MEVDESIYNGSQKFERYEDQPIVPHMVKPIGSFDEELIKTAGSEDRGRELNFSMESDMSLGTTGNNANLPHLKYFRTPSVVVSDHSEDTGCGTYDDIKRIRSSYHRRRRSRALGRRHSDAFDDENEKMDYEKRSESTVSTSTQSDATEYFRGSQNVSPVPRRKSGYRDGRLKSLSLDETLADFELGVGVGVGGGGSGSGGGGGGFERKTLSECSSSNELSPIFSRCCSSNYSETSSKSSMGSDISPVLDRKNIHFNEHQGDGEFVSTTKSEKSSRTYFQSREYSALDDTDILLLERQRSLSYDDLYHHDSSIISDMSYSDLSIDFSVCSSISNLPGTVYYKNYNPNQENQEYSGDFLTPRSGGSYSHKLTKSRRCNIKTSKSCSDFLSVSRIAEDYPHIRHRRHSNDQVSSDIVPSYSSKKCSAGTSSRDDMQRRWMFSVQNHLGYRKKAHASVRMSCHWENPSWKWLAKLQLKSFHESLNFQKENYLTPDRKSMSNDSIFTVQDSRKSLRESNDSCPRLLPKQERNKEVKQGNEGENKADQAVSENKKKKAEPEPAQKEWLSVEWRNGDALGDGDCGRRNFRKVSDCSTCSTYSGDHDVSRSSNVAVRKSKSSGWRKLRNIVQWTPFFQTYKKQRYPWVQLAGHQGNFKAGPEQGTILKKLCPKEEKCYKILMKDVLRPYVPEYKGQVTCDDSDCIYLQLQDLLVDFACPCVLDCKLGVRTYLEEELQKAKEKPKLRKDMYEKMIQIDPTAPTLEEHRLKAVTKPRYMVWRETISSTSTLGFRIEGVRKSNGKSSKDFKTTRTREEVKEAFRDFTSGFPHSVPKYVQRLKAIKATLEVSVFFSSHEIIGSSLLFVHDNVKANVWLIDFAKTLMLPDQKFINHKSQWEVGNHEDGYLIGINNLIQIFAELEEEQKSMASDVGMATADDDKLTTVKPSADQT